MMRLMRLFIVIVALIMALPMLAQEQAGDCSGLTPAPLVVGERGQVSPGQSNNVRDVPNREGARVGQIPGGETFAVLDGPVCTDGLVWWQVDYGGLVGWTVDGMDGEQWLLPATEPEVEMPDVLPAALSTTVITPENARQLQPLRTVSCESGSEFSAMITLGSRHVALNCGYYNMDVPGASFEEQGLNDRIGVIDLETGQQVLTLSGNGADKVYPIAFLPDERLLWYSQQSRNDPVILHLSTVPNGEETATAEIPVPRDLGLFSPDFYASGTRFAMFYPVDEVYVLHQWDAATLTLLDEGAFEIPEAYTTGAISFAISPDGQRFAVVYPVGTRSEIAVYTAANPQPELIISAPFEAQVQGVNLTFSPSGNFIIGTGCLALDQLSCARSRIFWWSAADGGQVAEWETPVTDYGSLLFSPDSDLLAMGTFAGAVLFDVDTGRVVHTLPGHATETMFSADGTFIVTSGDPETTVWTVGQ
jgi:hypothetical protein